MNEPVNKGKKIKLVRSSRMLAQELHYGRIDESNKGPRRPVRERIGNVQMRRKNYTRQNQKTIRLKRANGRVIPNLKQAFFRQSAGQRLTQIRRQQGYNYIQPLETKHIRSRRTVTNPTSNMVIQVKNTSSGNNYNTPLVHSVRGSLNESVQTQIRYLQETADFNHNLNIISPTPIYISEYGQTKMYLHVRFSRLP